MLGRASVRPRCGCVLAPERLPSEVNRGFLRTAGDDTSGLNEHIKFDSISSRCARFAPAQARAFHSSLAPAVRVLCARGVVCGAAQLFVACP